MFLWVYYRKKRKELTLMAAKNMNSKEFYEAMEQGKISYAAYEKISRGNALRLLGKTEI